MTLLLRHYCVILLLSCSYYYAHSLQLSQLDRMAHITSYVLILCIKIYRIRIHYSTSFIGNLCTNVFLEFFVSYENENVETFCVYHKEKLIINQKCLPYLQQNTYIRALIMRCQKSSRHYHSSRFGQLVSVYCLSLLPNSRNSDSTSLVKF